MGSEVNIVRKDAGIKVALCFPDTYEIGMSHLGLKVLYTIINNIPDSSAERVYAPWGDLESYLRQSDLLLTSLESERPLKEFDIIGFTLQYELSYTNVLNMMDLGGIPVRSAERGNDYPLVIAGGPCAVNPLPLVPFIDAFVVGDGEEVIEEILAIYKNRLPPLNSPLAKRGPREVKEDLLEALSKIEGIYVPSVHNKTGQKIKRRIVEDLDKVPYPDSPVIPYASIIHDRAAIEIARGCTRGCRFCQAGMICRPLRERSTGNVLALAERSISNTGYDEISFTSLSTGDYSCLLPLIRDFNKLFAGSRTSISLPSLRVGSINSDVLKEIKSIRKTGFTIAPEAGTERLRNVINKDFTEEEYEDTLTKLFSEGWKNIKLYFMIGLPTETMADIDGLINMAVRALRKGKEITGRSVNVNVGISAFVPKPHTPFQWIGQASFSDLREKQDYLKKTFRRKGINFKGQHVEVSLLEAIFSRGGSECSSLLEEAWRLGCRFDGWSEMFRFDKWLQAGERTGIDLYTSATCSYSPYDVMPWEFIDTGITKSFLVSEFNRAFQQKITPDCKDTCYGCGLECGDRKQNPASSVQNTEDPPLKMGDTGGFFDQTPIITTFTHKITVPSKMRLKFSKTGNMRYLSHNELMAVILRALRRANVPVAYSAGFHPHPKISFGPALAAGIEGLHEYFDIELNVIMDTSVLLESLNNKLPEGLHVLQVILVPRGERALSDFISRYEYEVITDNGSDELIRSFMGQQNFPVSRDVENIMPRRSLSVKGRKRNVERSISNKIVDIRPMVEKAEVKGRSLHLTLVDTDKAKVRLYEILKEMLQKPVEDIQETFIKRLRLYGYNNTGWVEPIEEESTIEKL